MASSTSRLATFSPPVLIMSFLRSTTVKNPSSSITPRSPLWNHPPPNASPPPPSSPHEPPRRAAGRGVAGMVDEGGFDVEHRAARRTRLADLVAGAEHCGCRCNLRLAVEVPEAHLGQAALQLLQDCNRHDRRPVVALGEAAEVCLREER